MDHRKMERTRTPGIFKRGHRYCVIYRDAHGKQRKESARTMEEARAIRAARTADRDRGELFAASKVLFRTYAEEWIERYQGRRGQFGPSTRESYKANLERYVYEYFGRKRLVDLMPRDIANFVGWLIDDEAQTRHDAKLRRGEGLPPRGRRELSDETVKNIVKPVKACLSTAVLEGLLRSNPAREIPMPNRPRPDDEQEQVKVLSRDQLATVIDLVNPKHRLFVEFLASTGLRISEALAIQWDDLVLDGSNPCVRVRRQRYHGRIEAPKWGRRRDVPLDFGMVRKFRRRRSESEWGRDTDLVFPNEVGKHHHAENLRKRHLRPVMQEAGVPWASFHTLRHTCATLLFARGRNARQVCSWLGHRDPAFTLKRYVHLLDGDMGEGLDLSAELGGSERATRATQISAEELEAMHPEMAYSGGTAQPEQTGAGA